MSSPRPEALGLTLVSLCITGAGLLLAASAVSPWGNLGGAAHPIVDLVQFVIAWAYLLGTPVVAGAALLLGRHCRWMAWSNAAVLGVWLLVFVASFFLHT